MKDYHDSNPNHISPFMQVNKKHILLKMEIWSKYLKNQLQSPNSTYLDGKA